MKAMGFEVDMMTKRYVAVVQNSFGEKFMVFETGDPRFYLFSTVSKDGCQGGIQFPVRKSDLRDDIRLMLRNGCGNSNI
jgi:hypothetical protein